MCQFNKNWGKIILIIMTGEEINVLGLAIAKAAYDNLSREELEDFSSVLSVVQCNLLTLKKKG